MTVPYRLPPGQLAGQRGTYSSRPGQADYVEMQLVEISDYIQRSPLVRHIYGGNVQIKVSSGPRGLLRFDIRPAPPAL